MVATSVAELDAKGRPSTRLFHTLLEGNSGQAEVGGGGAAAVGLVVGFGVGFTVPAGAAVGCATERGAVVCLAVGVGADVAREDGEAVAGGRELGGEARA